MSFWHSRRESLVACVVLLAGTLSIGWPLDRCNEEMREGYKYAFPDLQNARSVAEAKKILEEWKSEDAEKAIRGTMQTDLLFPFFYAPLVALLAYRASILRPTPWVVRLGRWLAIGALAGGIADLAENITMLGMLGDPGAASRLPLMLVFTAIKIAGAMLGSLYVVFAHLDS